MKNSSLFIFGIFVAFTFAACDEITGPYTEEVNVTDKSTEVPQEVP